MLRLNSRMSALKTTNSLVAASLSLKAHPKISFHLMLPVQPIHP